MYISKLTDRERKRKTFKIEKYICETYLINHILNDHFCLKTIISSTLMPNLYRSSAARNYFFSTNDLANEKRKFYFPTDFL